MLHDEYLPCHFFTSGVVPLTFIDASETELQPVVSRFMDPKTSKASKGFPFFSWLKGLQNVANERFIMSCTGGVADHGDGHAPHFGNSNWEANFESHFAVNLPIFSSQSMNKMRKRFGLF